MEDDNATVKQTLQQIPQNIEQSLELWQRQLSIYEGVKKAEFQIIPGYAKKPHACSKERGKDQCLMYSDMCNWKPGIIYGGTCQIDISILYHLKLELDAYGRLEYDVQRFPLLFPKGFVWQKYGSLLWQMPIPDSPPVDVVNRVMQHILPEIDQESVDTLLLEVALLFDTSWFRRLPWLSEISRDRKHPVWSQDVGTKLCLLYLFLHLFTPLFVRGISSSKLDPQIFQASYEDLFLPVPFYAKLETVRQIVDNAGAILMQQQQRNSKQTQNRPFSSSFKLTPAMAFFLPLLLLSTYSTQLVSGQQMVSVSDSNNNINNNSNHPLALNQQFLSLPENTQREIMNWRPELQQILLQAPRTAATTVSQYWTKNPEIAPFITTSLVESAGRNELKWGQQPTENYNRVIQEMAQSCFTAVKTKSNWQNVMDSYANLPVDIDILALPSSSDGKSVEVIDLDKLNRSRIQQLGKLENQLRPTCFPVTADMRSFFEQANENLTMMLEIVLQSISVSSGMKAPPKQFANLFFQQFLPALLSFDSPTVFLSALANNQGNVPEIAQNWAGKITQIFQTVDTTVPFDGSSEMQSVFQYFQKADTLRYPNVKELYEWTDNRIQFVARQLQSKLLDRVGWSVDNDLVQASKYVDFLSKNQKALWYNFIHNGQVNVVSEILRLIDDKDIDDKSYLLRVYIMDQFQNMLPSLSNTSFIEKSGGIETVRAQLDPVGLEWYVKTEIAKYVQGDRSTYEVLLKDLVSEMNILVQKRLDPEATTFASTLLYSLGIDVAGTFAIGSLLIRGAATTLNAFGKWAELGIEIVAGTVGLGIVLVFLRLSRVGSQNQPRNNGGPIINPNQQMSVNQAAVQASQQSYQLQTKLNEVQKQLQLSQSLMTRFRYGDHVIYSSQPDKKYSIKEVRIEKDDANHHLIAYATLYELTAKTLEKRIQSGRYIEIPDVPLSKLQHAQYQTQQQQQRQETGRRQITSVGRTQSGRDRSVSPLPSKRRSSKSRSRSRSRSRWRSQSRSQSRSSSMSRRFFR